MTLAIFPGSFDPITNGHVDLINRALKIFTPVVVSVLVNPSKTGLFTVEERMAFIKESVPQTGVQVASFEGLLVDFAVKCNASVILRGLRAVSDFEYELQMAMMNRELNHDLETVFLMPNTQYSFLSSRLVKEVASLGGDVGNHVPRHVEQALKDKFSKR